ncbi:minor tail protein [Idiomarinaceae phage Phi1M2-2]|uniref:minor tail protein n=1 Tax=Idiomarinaceae phage Phi1M2-2 TaxID=1527515 RepID=UPI0004F61B6E|nr:minor tail protein [Idiomarinaceae phage Phi1M2-2]AIM40774.1 putative tail protein [Idiomarinaceae phage Phi1M2-2]
MADGSSAVLFSVPESTIGTTPAAPAFTEFPFNSVDLGAAFDKIESERLGGRHMRCHRLGNKSADGTPTTYLYPVHSDPFLEAALCGTWDDNVLKTGTTRRGFTYEVQHADTTPVIHMRYKGLEVNELTITATAGQNVGLSLGLVGNEIDENHSQVAGATYTPVGDDCPYDSWSADLMLDGEPLATATELTITIANGIERLYGIGSRTAHRKSISKTRVTGSVTKEFDSVAQYQKWYNEQNAVMVATFERADGYELEVRIPKLKFTEAASPVSAEGQVTVQLSFVGEFDDNSETELQITRVIPE